jgi:hypothetical protein
VRIGTTQADALAALETIRHLIETRWAEMTSFNGDARGQCMVGKIDPSPAEPMRQALHDGGAVL